MRESALIHYKEHNFVKNYFGVYYYYYHVYLNSNWNSGSCPQSSDPPASTSHVLRFPVDTDHFTWLPAPPWSSRCSFACQPKRFSNIRCLLRTAHLGKMVPVLASPGRWFCRRQGTKNERIGRRLSNLPVGSFGGSGFDWFWAAV